MRRRPKLLRTSSLCAMVALTVLAPVSSPAWGAVQRGGEADAFVDERDNPTAEVAEASRSDGAFSGRRTSQCEWRVVVEDDSTVAVYDVDGQRMYSDTGRWLGKFCDGAQVPVGDTFTVPEGDGAPVDPVVLARTARESVAIAVPVVATSPSADRELYTQVPTWLWLEGESWGTHTATATAGSVSATVTARPRRTVWSMGDGHTVTCDGPGVPWEEGMAEDDTYCSHTYRTSSAGQPAGTFTISVTVHFAVTWTSNVGEGGDLAGVGRTGSRAVRVGEIQAVESG